MCKRASDTLTAPLWQYLSTQHQLRVINRWWCRSGNEGIEWIFELIIELLNSCLFKNTNDLKKIMNWNIVDLATSKTCKVWLLDINWSILIEYYNQIAKASMWYEFTDGPAVQAAENPPNSDGYGDVDGTVPASTAQVYWQPRLPIWLQLHSDQYPDPKWQSRPIANTRQRRGDDI